MDTSSLQNLSEILSFIPLTICWFTCIFLLPSFHLSYLYLCNYFILKKKNTSRWKKKNFQISSKPRLYRINLLKNVRIGNLTLLLISDSNFTIENIFVRSLFCIFNTCPFMYSSIWWSGKIRPKVFHAYMYLLHRCILTGNSRMPDKMIKNESVCPNLGWLDISKPFCWILLWKVWEKK